VEAVVHRHGPWTHGHHHEGPHRHAVLPFRSVDEIEPYAHGHSHRIDPSIVRSREGVQAVTVGLLILVLTALIQFVVFVLSGSVALLADLVHNWADALTALPLGAAFLLRSDRAERWSGGAVVAAILVSAIFAGVESVRRIIHPEHLHHLLPLAIAGGVGFLGNEFVARVRFRAGHRLDSPALLADGAHARADGYVSLGVIARAAVVTLGIRVADPTIGLVITGIILKVTFDAWRTVQADHEGHDHGPDANGSSFDMGA